MRINEIHVYKHNLPTVGGAYRMARANVTELETTIVEIVTDTGLIGFGESCPVGPTYAPQHALGARAALQEIAPHLIGADPLQIDHVGLLMDENLNGHRYAKAAVDIALWDIAGHAYNARLCDLLGGALQERVPSYYAIGICTPDEAARTASEMQSAGFPRLQLKVGGRAAEEDIAAIHKVREVLRPETKLVIDVNRGWTTRDALAISHACRNLSFVLEQPCNTLEETSAIRSQLCHPIFLDESTESLAVVVRAAGLGLCDGFGLKVTRLGGISTMRTVRDICRSCSLPHTCDDAWGGDIIAAACVHLCATVEPRLNEGAWIAAPYIAEHYDGQNGITVDAGHIGVPTGRGLGIHPDKSLWGAPVMSFGCEQL